MVVIWLFGDLDWTEINSRNFSSGISCMKYCKGKFYVVCCSGKIYAVDVAQPGVPSTSIVKPRLLVEYRLSNQFYLVEVSRALLLVDRYDYIRTPTGGQYSVNFKVLQLHVIKGEFKRISNLGESTIFLDRNGAISVDSSKFKFAGIKPNHIYLIDCRFEFYELPVDLLVQIANRVKVIEDFIALRVVCTSWRAAVTNGNFDVFSPQVPLLMLGAKDSKYREFYLLFKKKVSRVFLPEAKGRDYVQSEGWLCTMTYKGEMNLLHPFSRAQIPLPSLKSLMASRGVNKIPKQKKDLNWTPSHIGWDRATSIVYYKENFYCATSYGNVWVFDVEGGSLRVLEGNYGKVYLAEVSGALLTVRQILKGDGSGNFEFTVSEIDIFRRLSMEISNLGDSAIFLSRDGAISINCFGFPAVKPNHIYFTDDSFKKYKCERYMQAYNIE
ncbi:hypothetical protein BC332_00192 [Capsicum chinense]|nr:hypothetical protein BC332_00192 [Capsicum chinense]